MNNFLTMFIIFTVMAFSSLNGAVYKGQEVFKKECVSCHPTGQTFVKEKDIDAWKELMKNKGKLLADLHLKDSEAEESWEYFQSSKYSKKSKHLMHFLVEYAKDSGNVPACN